MIATHRHLYVYDLVNDPNVRNPQRVELDRHEQRPVKIEIVDGFFGQGGKFVVYLGLHGELVVRRIDVAGLPSVAELSNPGLTTFAVGGGSQPKAGWSKDIYVGGFHEHVMRIVFEPPAGSSPSTNANIIAASDWLGGLVQDLTWAPTGVPMGGDGLMAIVGGAQVFRFSTGAGKVLDVDYSIGFPGPGPNATPRLLTGEPRIVPVANWDLYAVLRKGQVFSLYGQQLLQLLGPGSPFQSTAYGTRNIPAARDVIGIAIADLDFDAAPDVILTTESGQVMWIPYSTLTAEGQINLSSIETLVLGTEWFGMIGATDNAVPDEYSSGSISSTWGMTFGPTANAPIEVVDQCGRRWQIDRGTGVPTYRHVVTNSEASGVILGPPAFPSAFIQPKPFRDLAYLGIAPPTSLVPFVYEPLDVGETVFLDGQYVGPSGLRWELNNWFDVAVASGTDVPVGPEPTASGLFEYAASPHTQLYDGDYLPFSFGGDVISVGTESHAYYWTGNPPNTLGPEAHDVVRGLVHDPTGPIPFQVWGSSTNQVGMGGMGTSAQAHMRNAVPNGTPYDAQSLRIGRWGQSPDDIRVIVGTVGGGLMALDPSMPPAQCLVADPDPGAGDHGFGGIALAVSDVRGTSQPTIFFGTVHTHVGSGGTDDLVSSLHVYDLVTNSLVEGQATLFDGVGGRPKLIGLCGLATGNLVDDTDGIESELVLTTLNGDLLVYDLDPSGLAGGVALGPLLHWEVYDGAMGATNAILIDEAATSRCVFVGCSMGMRKFEVVGT